MYYYGKLGIVRRKEELRLEHEQLVKAVCMVQRHYRGHLGYFKYLGRKRQVRRENQASIEIQRLVRGHLGRIKSEAYRNDLVEACIRVQRSYRNHSNRIHLILVREARLFGQRLKEKKAH